MILQILVNHYNEDINTVRKFLETLNKQKNIKFEVIIISDGGKINLSNENWSKYNFQIKYKYIKHVGVCHTRNTLLNISSADYLMFCDIDDEFENANGIKNMINIIKKENGNIIGSPIKQEIDNNNFNILNKDIIHLQGKIFKRQFLIDNNIQFYDELETNGDMMFLWLAYALSKKTIWAEDIFYIWKNNPNSVTRKDREYYPIISLPNVIYGYTLLGKELVQRNRLDLLQFLIPTVISMIYIHSTLIDYQNNDCPKHFKNNANKAVNNYLNNYFNFYKQLDENFRKQRYNLMFNYYNPPKELYNFDKLISWGERQIKQTDTLIVGYGMVGKNLEKELKLLNPDIYDKYNNYYWVPKMKKYKIAFICVPTSKADDEDYDISEVKNAILENDAEIYVVKSTVLSGTIEKLIQETGKHIILSPEYYNETQHCNNYNFNFTILGGNKQDCIKVQQILQKVYNGQQHKFLYYRF